MWSEGYFWDKMEEAKASKKKHSYVFNISCIEKKQGEGSKRTKSVLSVYIKDNYQQNQRLLMLGVFLSIDLFKWVYPLDLYFICN